MAEDENAVGLMANANSCAFWDLCGICIAQTKFTNTFSGIFSVLSGMEEDVNWNHNIWLYPKATGTLQKGWIVQICCKIDQAHYAALLGSTARCSLC